MEDLEKLAELKRQYEEAKSKQKTSQYLDMMGQWANNMVNIPSTGQLMGRTKMGPQLEMRAPESLRPQVSPDDVLKKYEAIKAMKEKRAYDEAQEEKDFERRKELGVIDFQNKQKLAKYKSLLDRKGG